MDFGLLVDQNAMNAATSPSGMSTMGRMQTLRKHSRTGCITCKVRKKRCSEDKPVCNDCNRLGFSCIYLPKSTDRRVLQKFKEQIEKELFAQKNKKKFLTNPISSMMVRSSGLQEEHEEDSVITPRDNEADLDDEFFSAHLQTTMSPLSPYLSQPLSDPVCMQLDSVGIHLYNYYRNHLANIISIAPTRQNYYLQVFLPMAHQHQGILSGLMAWSAHHLSITQDNEDSLDIQRDKNYLGLANKYTLESLQRLRSETDNNNFLWSLAQVLILCAAEICQGDVTKWKVLLKYGADLIEKNVGKDISKILFSNNYNEVSKLDITTRYWLVANFIYHDIMCSQGTFFPMEQYKRVLNQQKRHQSDTESETDDAELGLDVEPYENDEKLYLDPLHGINRPILLLLGDITNLTRKMKEGPVSFNRDHPQFVEFMKIAIDLQTRLHQIVPDVKDLKLYDEASTDYGLCLELFQLMQIAALIHLKTTCLKHSKHSIEIQYLWTALSEKLDLTLGSKLEGSLCFPMFICGINTVDQVQRNIVEARFDDIMKRYKCYNFQRARTIMRKVWKQDLDDSNSVRSSVSSSKSDSEGGESIDLSDKDWYDIVDEMGWDISFA